MTEHSKTKMAIHLHVEISNAISRWGMANAQTYGILPGETLTWVAAAAMGLELLVAAKSSGQPVTHLMNVIRDVVTRPDAIQYANDVVRNNSPKPGKVIT